MVCEQARADWRDWLGLLLTPGLGPRQAWQSLQQQPTPQAWAQPGPDWPAQCAATQAWLERDTNHFVVTLHDADYPQALHNLADPPLLLFGAGQRALLQAPRALAMVGSRNPTPQGLVNARQFAKAMVQSGLTVVSGLALGIDGAAHEGALEAFGDESQTAATVAIVGTGLDRVYPKAHFDLAHRVAQNGLLISEYPLGTAPLSGNFPKRNRLIAGLSQGTLVVEAALQSGSLISARLSSEQGKEVFAIPGSIHAAQYRGCHALIKQGAKLVESAQDILEEMRWLAPQTKSAGPNHTSSPPTPTAEHAEQDLLDALGYDPVSLDALSARTGQTTATLQAGLMTLELQGLVARLPGGLFQRQVS